MSAFDAWESLGRSQHVRRMKLDYGVKYELRLCFPRAELPEDTDRWKLVVRRCDGRPVATLGFIDVPDWTYPVRVRSIMGGDPLYEWFAICINPTLQWEVADRCFIIPNWTVGFSISLA